MIARSTLQGNYTVMCTPRIQVLARPLLCKKRLFLAASQASICFQEMQPEHSIYCIYCIRYFFFKQHISSGIYTVFGICFQGTYPVHGICMYRIRYSCLNILSLTLSSALWCCYCCTHGCKNQMHLILLCVEPCLKEARYLYRSLVFIFKKLSLRARAVRNVYLISAE